MNVRNLVGGAVVLAFIGGAWLGGLFPNLGRGPGDGSGQSGHEAATPSERATEAPEAAPEITPQLAGELADAARVLRVRVDGREYLLMERVGDRLEYRPATLNEVVAAAQLQPGDDSGIRVRISRTTTAKAATEIALRDALISAGVSADAIDWQDGPAP